MSKKGLPYALIIVLGIIQCLNIFHISVLPEWMHMLSLVLLILTLIVLKLDQMDQHLKTQSNIKEDHYEYHFRCKSN